MRAYLAKIVLRGWLLDLWMKWKAKRFSFIYTRELLDSSQKLLQAPRSGVASPKNGLSTPLPSLILFIADVMWEDFYLVPELERICPITTWNLHGDIQHAPYEKQSLKVASSIKRRIKEASSLEPSLIFMYLRSELLSLELFETLRRRFSCPIVGMNLDDQADFLDIKIYRRGHANYQYWAHQFDANLTSGKKIIDWYRTRDLPVYYMPPGVRRFPGLKIPTTIADFRYSLSFLGAAKGERKELITHLKKRGVEVECFGSGWPGSQWVDDPNKIFRSSMINLGVGTSFPFSRLTCTKARDFECPGVGGCYLTTFNWELTEHYEIGKEILCYSTIEELIEIYSYHRTRPEECLKLAQAAWNRCQSDHTWEIRFRTFFNWLHRAGIPAR